MLAMDLGAGQPELGTKAVINETHTRFPEGELDFSCKRGGSTGGRGASIGPEGRDRAGEAPCDPAAGLPCNPE
jgi:hypothetical protein